MSYLLAANLEELVYEQRILQNLPYGVEYGYNTQIERIITYWYLVETEEYHNSPGLGQDLKM